jgi:hypothetical protein
MKKPDTPSLPLNSNDVIDPPGVSNRKNFSNGGVIPSPTTTESNNEQSIQVPIDNDGQLDIEGIVMNGVKLDAKEVRIDPSGELFLRVPERDEVKSLTKPWQLCGTNKLNQREYKELVVRMAMLGLQNEVIAKAIGVSHQTLKNRLGDAMAMARQMANAAVADGIFRRAIAGDNASSFFWMKCQAGWNERHSLEVTLNKGKGFVDGPKQLSREEWEAEMDRRKQVLLDSRGEGDDG